MIAGTVMGLGWLIILRFFSGARKVRQPIE